MNYRYRFEVTLRSVVATISVDGNGASVDPNGNLVIADDGGTVLALASGEWRRVERYTRAEVEAVQIAEADEAR